MGWLLVLILIGCGGSASKDKEPDKGPALPVAKPATTWCDGKKCPCEKGGDEKETRERSKMCELSTDLVVQGVPCSKGHIQFWPDGRLEQCDLKSPVMVGKYECHVGVGVLWLHKDGSLRRCHVRGAQTVGPYRLAQTIAGHSAFDFELFRDGTLADGNLEVAMKIGERRCRAGKVKFHPGGKLYDCTIDAPVVVDETLTLAPGSDVYFGADGSVIGFMSQTDVTYKGELKKKMIGVCIVKDCNSTPQESEN